MKTIKKVLSAVLAVCLIMSLGLIGASAEASNTLKLTVDGFADGQQVSVVCMTPDWSGEQWYNDNENLIFVDQMTAKNGSVDIKVDVDNPVEGEYYIIVNGEIYRQALISTPAQTVTSDKDTYLVNEDVTLTVTTGTDIVKLGVFNESGKSIVRLSSEYAEEGNVRVWTVVVRIGTRGDRIISVKGIKEGQSFSDVDYLGNIGLSIVKFITPEPDTTEPKIIENSVSAPASAKVNDLFTVTFKTTKAVTNISIFNENGMGIVTNKAYVDTGDAREWTIKLSVGTAGSRVFGIKIASGDMGWLDSGERFAMKLAK